MNECLGGLRDLKYIACLDDILIYGRTFEEHLENLEGVLKRLKEKGIKLNAKKCHFFKREGKYLGSFVSKDGYRADPQDSIVLEKFRAHPKTVGELRSLLSFLGYYHCYVKKFSKILKPPYELLKTDITKPKLKKAKTSKKKETSQLDSKTVIEWTEQHQVILNEILDVLKSPELMSFPDFEKPFIVYCDASETGLGAVLCPNQKGKLKVVSYALSRLTSEERNCHLHSEKLEFAMTDRFHNYLSYGSPFDVYTDNNPLTYVLITVKLNVVGLRWVADLTNFKFKIHYRVKKQNFRLSLQAPLARN